MLTVLFVFYDYVLSFLNSLSKSSLEDCGSSTPCVCMCVIYVCVWLHHTLCVCMCVCPALSKSSLEECGSTTLCVCVCMCVCACVTLYLSQVWKTVVHPHSVCVIVICVICVCMCVSVSRLNSLLVYLNYFGLNFDETWWRFWNLIRSCWWYWNFNLDFCLFVYCYFVKGQNSMLKGNNNWPV